MPKMRCVPKSISLTKFVGSIERSDLQVSLLELCRGNLPSHRIPTKSVWSGSLATSCSEPGPVGNQAPTTSSTTSTLPRVAWE